MKNNFKDILKGKVVIVGIGNVLKGDDALGPTLVQNLQGCINATCLDVGTAPETYAGKIVKEAPTTVLLVDAVDLSLQPGEYEILEGADIVKSGFTTHDMSPHLLIDYIQNETNTSIFMLGIQPHHVSFGDDMSNEVMKTLTYVEQLIKEALSA
ncbi:hydrogenase 3 maturation endopeptidase HyCI [Candidatus Omnitrophota bacterium]